jgi:hypothetical protein
VVRGLRVRQYGNDIEHVDWQIDGSRSSRASPRRRRRADLVQDVVANLGTASPWGDSDEFMSARLVDGVAVREGQERLYDTDGRPGRHRLTSPGPDSS